MAKRYAAQILIGVVMLLFIMDICAAEIVKHLP